MISFSSLLMWLMLRKIFLSLILPKLCLWKNCRCKLPLICNFNVFYRNTSLTLELRTISLSIRGRLEYEIQVSPNYAHPKYWELDYIQTFDKKSFKFRREKLYHDRNHKILNCFLANHWKSMLQILKKLKIERADQREKLKELKESF